MPRRSAHAVLLALAAAALAGCTAHRETRVDAGSGGSWAAVLPAGDTPAWAQTRNDSHLNVDTIEPVLATNAWPERERPSLRRPVFVRIYNRPEGFIYYRSEQRVEYRRGW